MTDLIIRGEERERKFKPGDVVYIKGQRPIPLTVLGYVIDPRSKDEKVAVCWIDIDNHVCDAVLYEDVLIFGSDNSAGLFD